MSVLHFHSPHLVSQAQRGQGTSLSHTARKGQNQLDHSRAETWVFSTPVVFPQWMLWDSSFKRVHAGFDFC